MTRIRLEYLPPFDWENLLAWMTRRALPGVEYADADSYTTALATSGGPVVVRVSHDASAQCVVAEVVYPSEPDDAQLKAVTQCVRQLCDLHVDPEAIDAHLRGVSVLAPLVDAAPGMRIPGEVSPFVALMRALAGQQVSVAGGLAQLYRLVEATSVGSDERAPATPDADGGVVAPRVSGMTGDGIVVANLVPFPEPDAVLAAGFDWYRGPAARRSSIQGAVEFAASGGLDRGRELAEISRDLLALKGIGPWTVAYTLMRGYGAPDVDLSGDRALVNAAALITDEPLRAILDAATPWRSYAALHLWRVQ